MQLKTVLAGKTYQFVDIKEVMNKAGEERSGDILAGIAAETSLERVAAKHVLSNLTLGDLGNNPAVPYEDDAVTRVIQDYVHTRVYESIKNWSVAEFREYILSGSTEIKDLDRLRKGITSEMAAAVTKIMSNADLVYAAKKMPVVVRNNNTVGMPGRFSTRLQPNDTRDEVSSIIAQVYEGLSYGSGDAVIGINPVSDTAENTLQMLNALWEVIERLEIPAQNCVLAHMTTQMEAIRRGANASMIFQSISGSEKGLTEFGVTVPLIDEAHDLALHYCRSIGRNVLYFETGQGSALSAEAHHGSDQVTMEARCYGLARKYDPFLVNTVVGFIGPEYLYNHQQIIRAGLEDHFMGKLAISGDIGMTLIENAAWGVIASVTPSTNPAATVINNSISMISAGNSVVFAPHPGAKRVTQKAIQIFNEAIFKEAGVSNLLTAVKKPNIEAAQALFTHPKVALLVVTGGEAVVHAARKHATMRLIAAGAGNPPVVVDETANIGRAARSIYDGASFDNNIICADEKVVVAVDGIADALKREMCALGAVEITLEQAEKIAEIAFRDYPGPTASANPKWVGRNADVIARAAGLTVPEQCRLLIVDVGRDVDHPFVRIEQMMPVIPVARAKDVHEAIDWACKIENNLHHTAGMHSTCIDNLDAMAKRINTSLFVKNGPHIAGLGAGGEGWTSMTISTPTGEGVTSARSFARLRRCVLVDNFRIV